MKKIACVIVTYNRKALLKNCLDAVASQTYKPHTVYITDNASTDGTMDSVKEWGYYECEKNGMRFKYILNSKNEGGAGGFYLGIKTAHEAGVFDGIWVMDDDGVPKLDCLSELVKYINVRNFISPVVLSDSDKLQCAFYDCNYEKLRKKGQGNVIENLTNPFNGVLFSTKLVSEVGYPKKEMFIWGDEVNYQLRSMQAGYNPIMILSAIHYHPKDRQEKKKVLWRKVAVNIPDWKLYCYVRNLSYNTKIGSKPKRFFKLAHILIPYFCYYMKRGKTKLIVKATVDGVFERFDKLELYR